MKSIASVEELEEMLSEPTEAVLRAIRKLEGDYVVLGVGGKMGPTLARMIRRALESVGKKGRVIGVSRFSQGGSGGLAGEMNRHGIETVSCDLLDRSQIEKLPEAANVVYMAGMKFGSTGNEALTWAMNTFLPALVCEKYRQSRIAAFSTGNVYGLVKTSGGGSVEGDKPNPVGEYAMSCLGRERMFEHFSRMLGVPVTLIRLNYAVEMRYGVLLDLAQRVWEGREIDLGMGHVNVIWQRDANAMSIASLVDATSPPFILNVAGPEVLAVRDVAERLGDLMGKRAKLVGEEAADALLNNGRMGWERYGRPSVSAERVMEWTAQWVKRGGATLDKPTHFEARDGKF